MAKLTAYLYPKCGTCRQAKAWLGNQGYEINEINIAEDPPTKEELKKLWSQSGEELKKFFNTSGMKYRELGIKDKLPNLSEDEQLELLSSDGMLIKRPIVTDGSKVTIGFKDNLFADAWGK
ncbi:arsenate reductase family protein [Bacillus horti]|uniref:Arsenate reductase n=1 Tax=Caldalkalibacillus horti TaxID=77523 RepID=A0ABT9VTZ7_9BACI|nr:arsenate reductase family protein [Bacillus horti]MDQ0164455.1 arsenate reductase [Bacillus horti]